MGSPTHEPRTEHASRAWPTLRPRARMLTRLMLVPGLMLASGSGAVNLRVVATTAPSVPTACDSLHVEGRVLVTVVNDGVGPVSVPFDVVAFVDADRDGRWDAGGPDERLGSARMTGAIASGGARVVSIPVTGELPMRDGAIAVALDTSSEIIEEDETDNVDPGGARCSQPTTTDFDPVIEWESVGGPSLGTPMVGDVTGDGSPDVAVGDIFGVVRVLDGRDGRLHWTSPVLATTESNLALAQLDADPGLEVVFPEATQRNLVILDDDGSVLRRTVDTALGVTDRFGTVTVADLDCDGRVELVLGPHVFEADDGSRFWTPDAGTVGASGYGGPISVVVDLDLDGVQEVVAGPTAYRLDPGTRRGTIAWRAPLEDGLTAVAELDGDDGPELVLVTRSSVCFLDGADGRVLHCTPRGSGEGPGGAPTVADFDGDGEPEVGVAGARHYTLYETDGSVRWDTPTRDGSSGATGSTVFDFDNDGSAEVVYRDEQFLRVYRGSDGTVLASLPAESLTSQELPVVADCDGDGQAEILTTICDDTYAGGVRVFGDRNANWVGTRALWPQHAYHVTEWNDDGTPVGPGRGGCEAPSWLLHGTYRAQPTRRDLRPGADLSLFLARDAADVGCLGVERITALVGNAGTEPVAAGLALGIWVDRGSGAVFQERVVLPALDPGDHVEVERVLDATGLLGIFVLADDDGSGTAGLLAECREDNNACSVIPDPAGGPTVPREVGPMLRATGHGDPRAALIQASFDWSGDPGIPRPAGEHYHVLRGTRADGLRQVDAHDLTDPRWSDVTPAADVLPFVHYLRILPAGACEIEGLD